MAVPTIIGAGSLLSAGVLAADVTVNSTSTSSTYIIAGSAIVVALIGLAGTILHNRRRNRSPDPDPKITPESRLLIVETNQAEMNKRLDRFAEQLEEILDHVRPWPASDERHRR